MLQQEADIPTEIVTRQETSGRGKIIIPLLLVLSGVMLIAIMGRLEAAAQLRQRWSNAIFAPDAPLPPDASSSILPVWVRQLSLPYTPATESMLTELKKIPNGDQIIRDLGLDHGEYVVMTPLPPETLAGLLASGRPPEPGRLEAVAGDLASRDTFTLDGQTYQVVGHLQRGVSGLNYAYLVLKNDATALSFSPHMGAVSGWLDPDGTMDQTDSNDSDDVPEDDTNLEDTAQEQDESIADTDTNSAEPDDHEPTYLGGVTRNDTAVSLGVIAGLILVAIGGSKIQYRLLTRFRSDDPTRRHIFNQIAERPRLFTFINVTLFAAFFTAMFMALLFPLASLRLAEYVRGEFLHGGLSGIGNAYQSGDILWAAEATFRHNYFVATLLYTILPSLIVPFVGFIKNLLTFASVGFLMAPQWSHGIDQLVYHCITMTLELEAYVVATFAIVVYPIILAEGLIHRAFVFHIGRALKTIMGTVVLTAIMLAIAALYEATTIILFRS